MEAIRTATISCKNDFLHAGTRLTPDKAIVHFVALDRSYEGCEKFVMLRVYMPVAD